MSDSSYMFGQWAADDDGEASESARAEYEQQARIEEERQSDSSLREALAEALYLHDNRNALIQADWSKAMKLSRQQYLQRADAVLALFGSESCLGDGVCTNPKCPVHGIKEEPSDSR